MGESVRNTERDESQETDCCSHALVSMGNYATAGQSNCAGNDAAPLAERFISELRTMLIMAFNLFYTER
jgi:hypothetical protein